MLLATCDTPTEILEPSSLLWSVLRIETGKELLAGRHLDARGITNYIPTYPHVRRWKDHAPQELQRALFPGYAFALFPDQRAQSLALQSPSVYDILTISPGQPALLDEIEMNRIHAIGQHQGEPWQNIEPGQRVRILDGPFADVVGLLIRRRGSLRFVIAVPMLGQSASVEVDAWQLEAIR
jgi:transcriptional antiterminator RfaH